MSLKRLSVRFNFEAGLLPSPPILTELKVDKSIDSCGATRPLPREGRGEFGIFST